MKIDERGVKEKIFCQKGYVYDGDENTTIGRHMDTWHQLVPGDRLACIMHLRTKAV